VARVRVMYWKEIPYGVRGQDESGQVTRPLPQEFQEAIDALAMRTGATSAEDYQAGFRWGAPEERPGSAAEAADAMVAVIVAEFPSSRLEKMAQEPE
jgi:Virulence factor